VGCRPLLLWSASVAVYTPGARPAVSTLTSTACEPPGATVPLLGLTASHGAPDGPIDQVRSRPPVWRTVSTRVLVWSGGTITCSAAGEASALAVWRAKSCWTNSPSSSSATSAEPVAELVLAAATV